jgi:hypothetical protein
LGELAEIHIQSLLDGANEGRATRRAKHHWRWRQKREISSPSRAMSK